MTLHCKSAEEVVTGWGGNFKAVALLVKTNQTTITVVLTTACSLVKCTTSHRVVGNSKKKKKRKRRKVHCLLGLSSGEKEGLRKAPWSTVITIASQGGLVGPSHRFPITCNIA